MSATPKAPEAKAPEAKAPEAKPVQNPPAVKQKSPADVDPVKYDRYTKLKLLDLSGTKLTDEVKKELSDLEKELKACSGKKPIRTVTAAIGNERTVLIEGIPVTKEIEKFVKDVKATEYYFGK